MLRRSLLALALTAASGGLAPAARAQAPEALRVADPSGTQRLRLDTRGGLVVSGTVNDGAPDAATIPASGAGARLMFWPEKGAFRAGAVFDTDWDAANVGFYSTALGANTRASGYYSTALGSSTTANGDFSTALGYLTTASGDFSSALGYLTTASGDHATALGFATTAQASGSVAVGRYNAISGSPSTWDARDPLFVAGNGTDNNNRSNALTLLKNGDLTLAGSVWSQSGGFVFPDGSVQTTAATGGGGATDHGALGGLSDDDHPQYLLAGGVRAATDGFAVTGTFDTGAVPATGAGVRMMWYPRRAAFRAGRAVGVEWDASNIGEYSTAMGYGARASGNGGVALGRETQASGYAAVALGEKTTASGSRATALGYLATASGDYATAMGQQAAAGGSWATALGRLATASGTYSTALGDRAQATGYATTALGQEVTASGDYATALGSLTTASGGYATAMGSGTTASGLAATALGEHTTAQAFASLAIGRYNTVAGSTTIWNATDPLLVAGNGASGASRSNALTLFKNGNLLIAGTLTQSSDARLKEDVAPLSDVLGRLAALRPVTYRFREGTNRPRERQIGLLAQEVRDAFPELVTEGADGILSVAYGNLSAVLVGAVNEQEGRVEALEAENARLRGELDAIQERLARIDACLSVAESH